MKLLQRYILGELIRVFALMIVILTLMLVFVGIASQEQALGPDKIVQILPYVVPSMLPFTIPATLLLSVTVVYGRVAGDLEVTAAKAAGVNPLSLLTPAFLLGLVLAVASFGLTNNTIPWAIGNIERIVTQAMEDIFIDVLSAQHFVSHPDKGYSITVEDVRDGILINPTFKYRNGEHEQLTMKARLARIRFDLEERIVRVQLRDAVSSMAGRDSGARWAQKEIPLPMDAQHSQRKPRHMTISQIEERMADFEQEKVDSRLQRDQEAAMLMMTGDFDQLTSERMTTYANYDQRAEFLRQRHHTEIHSRYALAGSCLFFAFLGGPFAILQARRQFITSFIMCFLPILLFYYPLIFLMVNLGKSGSVDPTWAMWIPNAVLAVTGLVVLRKVIKH